MGAALWANGLAVGVGAMLGAWVRWGLGLWLNPILSALPLGTLAANLVGGLLMGLALGLFQQFTALPVVFKLFLVTGFLGGLTTFSSFSGEIVGLLQRAEYGWAVTGIGLHLLGSLSMTALGWMLWGRLYDWIAAG